MSENERKPEFVPGTWIKRKPGYQPETVWLVGFDPGGDAVVQFPDGLFITDISTWEPVPPTRKVTTWLRKYITTDGFVGYANESDPTDATISDNYWGSSTYGHWLGEAYSETHEVPDEN